MATRREKLFEQLSDAQQRAIYMLLEQASQNKNNPDYLSMEDIAETLEIERKTLYNWRTRNAVFQEALAEASREQLSALAPQAFGAMSKLISGSQPSTKALDLMFKSLGWVKNEQTIDLTTRTRDSGDLEDEIERLSKLMEVKSD
ncbi:hypothetical protein BJM29_12775 [Listeria monocytogenes]|uniref:phBC6A51 family helix-turn-helix protein n=1 Tax=Listeria monocytogenes TaxID=1639 RepID=UPI0008747B3F|nr:phBC6A51 family helix-turn-helix protein [Listeria monocytogenes]OFF72294.1 hypothetical protein BJM29_12775 [Listeria monocytogenes]OFF89240.1 hypothetical protein BJM52_14355 [Listeria monocytogenes]